MHKSCNTNFHFCDSRTRIPTRIQNVFIDGVVLLHLQGTGKVLTSTMLILSNVWHQNASQKPPCALGYTSKILCLQMA
jgi:hypothetical protein